MTLMSNAVVRAAEIRSFRSTDTRRAVFTSVMQTQILFWAWVMGWSFGPEPLLPIEIGVGAVFSLALGLVSSWLGLRRYVERQALYRFRAREAGKRRRVVIFEDHLWLDDEIVVCSEISAFAVNEGGFSLEYEPSTGAEKCLRNLSCGNDERGWVQQYFTETAMV